ncbi:uncharacterized protein LOC110600459 isoform X2 [Manihot esculenta]|uniref:HMA domain-containing protein n=1 Tax=Manihot esculenta TaxID=3983 RepID=A0A2C9ULD8_MANES|nr:uncharacterized protein LOC110600459 isoform X2 [Manihot esculenta]XP_043806384.1 uncharacterized protein LOC110600459 isoform X2 [Manihot esculenta]OAY31297.1 hypothetical protein MANES_14G100600v8 [Manihot esculenta]
MAFGKRPKKATPAIELKKPKNMLLPEISLASVESLSVPLVQEVVLSADIRCAECQKRVAEIMSRMTGTDSVSVNVLEKKVTVTCRYPGVKLPSKQVAAVYRTPPSKITIFKRIFRSACS